MVMKWCMKLETTQKRSPIVFQGNPSNFKVTRGKKSPILSRIEGFRTLTLVWIHRWFWNHAQSLMYHRRGSLLFFKVMYWISRSHGAKNRRFWPELSVSGQHLQLEFTEGFEMMHKAWCNVKKNRCHQSNFKVTWLTNRWFESNLSKIARPVAAIKSLTFALLIITKQNKLQWNLSVTTTSVIKCITCDLFNNVF